jgi:hypothetical protein
MWAKVTGGVIVSYPYGPAELARDNPDTSFPDVMSPAALDGWGIVPVSPRNPPAHDYITQNCVRITPTLEDDEWVETWEVSAASPEEIAQRNSERRAGMRLSFAQLMIGLVTEAWITQPEGEAWLAGTLPLAVLTVIDGLPVGQQFAAKARAIRPSEVMRADPLVAAMGTAAGKTEAEIDTFFQTYSGV